MPEGDIGSSAVGIIGGREPLDVGIKIKCSYLLSYLFSPPFPVPFLKNSGYGEQKVLHTSGPRGSQPCNIATAGESQQTTACVVAMD